jgi:Penicillinase repressor
MAVVVRETGLVALRRFRLSLANQIWESKQETVVARPVNKELTDRELEVMHGFWRRGEMTASDARDELARVGHDLAYVTVANLTRILVDKEFLEATNDQRPFRYRSVRSFDEAARSLVAICWSECSRVRASNCS